MGRASFKEKRIIWKADGKKNFRKHYFLFAFLCLIAVFFGVEYTSETAVSALAKVVSGDAGTTRSGNTASETIGNVMNKLLEDKEDEAKKDVENNLKSKKETSFLGIEVGRTQGVIAAVVNHISSGQFLTSAYDAIASIIKSRSIVKFIYILLAIGIMFSFWAFIENVYMIFLARFFLEGRIYEKVPHSRVDFLLRTHSWIRAAMTMLLRQIYHILWYVTIIGGIIKGFSYFPIPYIIAENPRIKPREAIRLSNSMMKGYKWELFKLGVSFLGWNLLNILTLDLLGIFYLSPYKESVYAEFYIYVRQNAKIINLDGIDKLNDKYLYEYAPREEIASSYEDIIQILSKGTAPIPEEKGHSRRILKWFGIVYKYNDYEEQYRKNKADKFKILIFKDMLLNRAYPRRLYPIKMKEKEIKEDKYNYLRHYSVSSLILMFFFSSIIGWIWEVSIHLVEDGEFINRGTMHGPWLPIYGTGGILMLVLLKKLREKPVKNFFGTIVLAGIVEYSVSWYLDKYLNQKYWDYSHYFLNIRGRVTLEGLLIFGIGGMAFIYFLAPILDNYIRKIPYNIVVFLCVFLLSGFIIDAIYTQSHPNIGKGINDYACNIEMKKENIKIGDIKKNDSTYNRTILYST